MTTQTLRLYQSMARLPAGKWLFAKALCVRAPYFSTLRPRVHILSPGRTCWSMRKRRRVLNHIGTVHALAIGNLCELAAGTLMECTIPSTRRWIPKGMQIEYLRKAESDVTAEAILTPALHDQTGDLPVEVVVRDKRGEIVVRARISMYVTDKSRERR